MSRDVDDWSDLQSAWRQDRSEPDEGFAERLRAQVRRERARSRVEAIAEAAVSLFCAIVFLWWASGATGGARLLFLALAIATFASLLVTSALRRSLWRAHGASAAEYRSLLRRRAQLGLTFARMGYIGAPLGVAMGFAVARFTGRPAPAGAEGLTSVIAVIACATLAMGWVWALREARRHRNTIKTLTAEPD